MRIRAQIGMVLNLDKCIGCHTCSVTCKNVWTSRDGVEYALSLMHISAIRQPKTAGLTELARVHARGLFERDAEVCRLRDQQVRAADPAAALRTLASAWGEGL